MGISLYIFALLLLCKLVAQHSSSQNPLTADLYTQKQETFGPRVVVRVVLVQQVAIRHCLHACRMANRRRRGPNDTEGRERGKDATAQGGIWAHPFATDIN